MKFIIDNWVLILLALSSGGMLAWPMLQARGAGSLTAQGAVQLINRERAVVVDLRSSEQFSAGHITNARNVPQDQLEAKLPTTVKNKNLPLILVCDNGSLSQRAVAAAQKLGYQQAQALAGGLRSWKAANLPVEKA